MSFVTLTTSVLLVLSATTVSAGRYQGRSLRSSDTCGHYGACGSGYWCGNVDAKQCYKVPTAEEVCSEEDKCLEDLEECGPEAYCKYNEKCVKDEHCYSAWEEHSKKNDELEHGEQGKESSCFKCVPIAFKGVCKKMWVESCKKVPFTECKDVPSEECASVPDIECTKVDVPKKNCKDVKVQECVDIPKQVCNNSKKHCETIYPCQESGEHGSHDCPDQTCIYTVTDHYCRKEKKCKPIYRGKERSACDCPMHENCIGGCNFGAYCSAKPIYEYYADTCKGLSAYRCQSYSIEECKEVEPVCREEYETVCKDVTKRLCETEKRYEKECKKVWKENCETVYVKKCYPSYKQKCTQKEVEKCSPAEGVKCGKYTCALGQKCGKECKIQVEEFEECKNVSVKACIPE